MSGPLPNPGAMRRNKPTIPTTNLPVSGRSADLIPEPPETYDLREKGQVWWSWAWTTPQACAWDEGALFLAARRAQLEDDVDLLESVEIDLDFLLGERPTEAQEQLRALIMRMKAMAGGKLSVQREMRQIDDRLGLTPKGLAQLRWKIVEDEEPSGSGKGKPRGRRGLKVAG